MERARYIRYKGKQIYLIDISSCTPKEGLPVIEEANDRLKNEPENSLLIMIYVKGAGFDKEVVKALKELAVNTKKPSKKAAVVGVEGIQKVIYHAVMRFSERNLPIFDTIDEAKDYLIKNASLDK